MDYNLCALLKMIHQEVICCIGNDERLFQNGSHAIIELQEDHKFYSLTEISAINNTVVLLIHDIAEEIQNKNNKFSEDYVQQFGHEPSFLNESEKGILHEKI